jgi:Bacteriophage lambda head decoration protein D
MPVLHEPMTLGDLLKYEAPNLYSRDEVVVGAGQTLALGAVVGRVTATREIVALDPTASDGRETVAGVLIEAVTTSATERRRSVIVARHAILFGGVLVFPASLTSEQTAAALAQLAALGVLVRQFPQSTTHAESVQ